MWRSCRSSWQATRRSSSCLSRMLLRSSAVQNSGPRHPPPPPSPSANPFSSLGCPPPATMMTSSAGEQGGERQRQGASLRGRSSPKDYRLVRTRLPTSTSIASAAASWTSAGLALLVLVGSVVLARLPPSSRRDAVLGRAGARSIRRYAHRPHAAPIEFRESRAARPPASSGRGRRGSFGGRQSFLCRWKTRSRP
jgi:hypothetical protein